jgi:ribosomal-protein-alanine N-acetyltransferase
MKPIETDRLLLRPFVVEDAEALHREIYSDLEVVRYYSGKGVLTLEQTRQHILEHLGEWSEETLGRHAVFLKEDGQLLGQVHLNWYVNTFNRWSEESDPRFNSLEVELAFAVGRRYWGKGFAFEACQAMIQYAFVDLRLKRLVGGAMTPNLRSVNLQRRLGYRVEKNLAPAPSDDPRWSDPGWVTILDNTLLHKKR